MPTEFRALYESHVRFVWRALLRMGVWESDLPDAVQDVFVIIHRKRAEFDGRSKVTTWIFSICARVASDRRRAARIRREVAFGDDSAPIVEVGACEALFDRRRARVLLESILDGMPEEQRVVFALFEFEGISGDDIAELLGIRVGTMRSRLRLARKSFDKAVSRLKAQGLAPAGALLEAMRA